MASYSPEETVSIYYQLGYFGGEHYVYVSQCSPKTYRKDLKDCPFPYLRMQCVNSDPPRIVVVVPRCHIFVTMRHLTQTNFDDMCIY